MNRRLAAAAATVVACAAIAASRRRATAGVQGAVGRRLATWIPPRPRTTPARCASLIWAAPMTLAGLLAGAIAGVRPQVRDGVLLFAPARGITGRVVRRRGFAAAGLGHCVIALEDPSPALMTHELVHVRQAERLGPFMAPAYLTLLAVHGYRRHPMEQAARLAASQMNGDHR